MSQPLLFPSARRPPSGHFRTLESLSSVGDVFSKFYAGRSPVFQQELWMPRAAKDQPHGMNCSRSVAMLPTGRSVTAGSVRAVCAVVVGVMISSATPRGRFGTQDACPRCINLSRAVSDPNFSQEILQQTRDQLISLNKPAKPH